MMFGQQPYVYQQPIYSQPTMPPMQPAQEQQGRVQYPPQGMPMSQPQNYGRTLICVPNRKSVDDFLVCPGETVAFWNVNEPIIYVKKGKSVGGADTITYDLVERAEALATPVTPQTAPMAEYVTRKDFDELAAKVAALSVKPVRKTKEAENNESAV